MEWGRPGPGRRWALGAKLESPLGGGSDERLRINLWTAGCLDLLSQCGRQRSLPPVTIPGFPLSVPDSGSEVCAHLLCLSSLPCRTSDRCALVILRCQSQRRPCSGQRHLLTLSAEPAASLSCRSRGPRQAEATCGVSPDPWHWPSPEHRPLLLAGNPRASPLDQDLGGEVKIMTVKAVGEARGGEGQEEEAAGGGEPRAPRPGLRSWSTCGHSQPRPRSHLTADRLRVTSRLGVRFLTCDMAVALDSVGFYSCLSCKTDTEGKGSKEGLREDRAGGKASPERGALG